VAWSTAHVDGEALLPMLEARNVDITKIESEVRNKAYNIISAKGETCFGISSRTAYICKAILSKTRTVLPLSHFIPAYGVCLSLPCLLSAKGVSRVAAPLINKKEIEAFHRSATAMQDIVAPYRLSGELPPLGQISTVAGIPLPDETLESDDPVHDIEGLAALYQKTCLNDEMDSAMLAKEA
jgi:lactate/malate dehydrogenase, alpha/beta C-terminal domain